MKLGYCFLVKEALHFQPLWQAFFSGVDPSHYRVYLHGKHGAIPCELPGAWVDPEPLATAWGSLSLVQASKRLFERAFAEGCDSLLLLSGDMLPLWRYSTIANRCRSSRFSLQPTKGLNLQQQEANQARFEAIGAHLKMPVRQLRKQNMFFAISSHNYAKVRQEPIEAFPLAELADEYYWINQLRRLGHRSRDGRYVYCNPDSSRTQAVSLVLDPTTLRRCRSQGYLFLRKVSEVSDPESYLKAISEPPESRIIKWLMRK